MEDRARGQQLGQQRREVSGGQFSKLVFEGGKPPNIVEGVDGMEYQIVDDERHPDGQKSTTRSGSLYQFVGFDQNLVKPAGQLNHSKVVVKGNHIEHPIALQSHTGAVWLATSKCVGYPSFGTDSAAQNTRQSYRQKPGC